MADVPIGVNRFVVRGINNAALVANRFDSGHDNGVDIPMSLRFNRMSRFGCDDGFVVPEVRASRVHSAN